jgi:hypothetical protein
MDYMGGLSSILSIMTFAVFAACVLKVFQMATTLTEIKDLLITLKRNAPLAPSSPLPLAASGEEMLQAALSELDHPANPTSIQLGNQR